MTTKKAEEIKQLILDAHDKFIVTFIKKDGTERKMICSKIELAKDYAKKLLEEEKQIQENNFEPKKTARKVPEGNIMVMEEKDGKYQKRSIILDSITYLGIVKKEIDISEYTWEIDD